MTMTNAVRKFVLSVHITFSVGWLGALVGYLALVTTGLNSEITQTISSAYIATELIGWFVILPACLGSLLSGLILSLGSSWGLFRYYWILIKFLLSVGASFLLLLHMQQISLLAELASKTPLPNIELRELATDLIIKAAIALLVLLIAITLSVYKPWGLTRYGLRKQQEKNKEIPVQEPKGTKPWGRYALIGLACLLLLFIILHLAGGGMGHH